MREGLLDEVAGVNSSGHFSHREDHVVLHGLQALPRWLEIPTGQQ
ncbi:hypothetical protein HSB1_39520 [Halogranum salarium B-1]|uniref:Uncharacterized protein n=1 Tax=Halogranum salarium B-1 TaxID=1210908 RepID=J3JDL4_9EURY|nr:hypothetical protein HSB1_39520 [Halogranum salarium B-1]